jgi:hypothetical protein
LSAHPGLRHHLPHHGSELYFAGTIEQKNSIGLYFSFSLVCPETLKPLHFDSTPPRFILFL